MSEKISPNETVPCDECGRFGAIEVADRKLCPECYETSGSCCPGLGREEN